jgi:hypothetical protein
VGGLFILSRPFKKSRSEDKSEQFGVIGEEQ